MISHCYRCHCVHLSIFSATYVYSNHCSTIFASYYIIRSVCWIMFIFNCHLNESSFIFLGDAVENEISLVALDDLHVRTWWNASSNKIYLLFIDVSLNRTFQNRISFIKSSDEMSYANRYGVNWATIWEIKFCWPYFINSVNYNKNHSLFPLLSISYFYSPLLNKD